LNLCLLNDELHLIMKDLTMNKGLKDHLIESHDLTKVSDTLEVITIYRNKRE
jgi:hypothetical protein